jgi:diguanylate cyclase (GGDEF)-like protein
VSTFMVFVAIAVSVADVSGREDRLVAALQRAASTDPLTGLLNRRAWATAFDELIEAAEQSGRPLSVVVFDLDHFKLVNDRFGHAAGDEALRTFADLLAAGGTEGDLIARSGGEEFAMALPGRDEAAAAAFARSVAGALDDGTRDTPVPLTVSAGVACLDLVPASGTPRSDALLNAADQALYAAKEAGRNRVAVASPPQAAPAHLG